MPVGYGSRKRKRKVMTETVENSELLEVRGDKPLQIQEDLDVAVDRAVSQATRIGHHGVLVIQHSPTFYTVALSPDVPYGQIQERRMPDSASA
jgi:hypothetical protein